MRCYSVQRDSVRSESRINKIVKRQTNQKYSGVRNCQYQNLYKREIVLIREIMFGSILVIALHKYLLLKIFMF